MSKITIAQLETAETTIQELTFTEMDATKGGLLNHLKNITAQVGIVNVDDSLNGSLNGNKVLSGNDIYF